MQPPFPLRIFRGPYTSFLIKNILLGEGEPFEATITRPSGTDYTFLIFGGHDVANKIIAAAGQTCQGTPDFQAPAGCEIYDTLNQFLWISNGWTGGVPANGLDVPQRGSITATNFLGWTQIMPPPSPPPPPINTIDGGTWV